MSRKVLYSIFCIVIMGIGIYCHLYIQGMKKVGTWRQMYRFCTAFNPYTIGKGKIYEKSLKEAYDAMVKSGVYGKDHEIYRLDLIKRGRDAWGRPFIYDLREDGYVLSFRSMGPNGKDEGGKGDDIEEIIDHRWLKKEFKYTTSKPKPRRMPNN